MSTSTTGFVGAARRGPVSGTPELITSFGDFARIYGGLEDLDLAAKTNYLAHSVRAYFDNGGSRLYVARVFQARNGGGYASSGNLTASSDAAEQVSFEARFPGKCLNGRVVIRLAAAPATKQTLLNAPDGTLVAIGGEKPAKPAQIEGGPPPYYLRTGTQLRLQLAGGATAQIEFRGRPAEATGDTALADSIDIDEAHQTFTVTVDGQKQAITLPLGAIARDDLDELINPLLTSGYARIAAQRLVIGSDRRGKLASVTVEANGLLGFTATVTAQGSTEATNNVNDLTEVTADEINALLMAANAPVRAGLTPATQRLALATTATGEASTLTVAKDDDGVYAVLGLEPATTKSGTKGATVAYYLKQNNTYLNASGTALDLSGVGAAEAPTGGAEILTVIAATEDRDGNIAIYEGLGFGSEHPRWIGNVLRKEPTRRIEALENPYYIKMGSGVDPFELMSNLFATGTERNITMTGGDDGAEPNAAAFKTALEEFEKLEDISIVAAPGAADYEDGQAIGGEVVMHAEKRRAYRIAVLDTPQGQAVSEARATRSRMDSKYAALYYPWVVVSNPLWRVGQDKAAREITLPPSGFICGIYARNDIERGVAKAPANEVVRGALRFETDINFAQQEVLNPLGVNCLRFFPGRGYRVWGARTASSDPEWKYVNVRRYFNYLEASLDRGTQWAVFENNGERLWANLTDTVSSFLYNEWVNGALLGANPKEAFFVRCDRTTMTQNDLDNGRLVCLVGVAALKPAEFVIFRIGQKTADARN